MTNGIFKPSTGYAYARAPGVMSTKSEIGFEWSVKLIGTGSLYVGIASQQNSFGPDDQNAIEYSTFFNDIRVGSNSMHSNLTSHKNGDVIRFRFQPQSKKLLIDLVRKNTPKLKKL